MKCIFSILIMIVSLQAFAQKGYAWSIFYNNKKVYASTKLEGEHFFKLSPKAVTQQTGDKLTIKYSQISADKTWQRTFYLTDESDQVLHTITLSAQTGTVHFPASYLTTSALNKKPVYIYTTSLPTDEKKASVIRVRRVLLGTIGWL